MLREIEPAQLRAERELRCELHRLSTALTCPLTAQLTVYQRRELDGAVHALSWALGAAMDSPLLWIVGAYVAERVDALAAARLVELIEPTPERAAQSSYEAGSAARARAAYDRYGGGFMDRSQPPDRAL